jgi:RimJ/RimL family protein N-acetyltransferase
MRYPSSSSRGRSAPLLSDVELMELEAIALYRHDERGRLIAVNEPGSPPAPRLYVGLTRAGHIWRFRHDLPDSLIYDLDRLLRTEPPSTDLTRRPTCYDQLQATLAAEAPVTATWFGPDWRFPDQIEVPAGVVKITDANLDLLRQTFPWLADELPEWSPCMAVIQDGNAVSVCFSSRNTPTAAAAGVETLEAFRGRGYAPAVVAAWALAVRASGRAPLYSTSWDNLASQAVARKLGLVLFGAEMWFG